MRNDYLKHIELLRGRADQLTAARLRREQNEAPFAEIHIDRLLGDGAALVITHLQGRRGKTQQSRMTLKEAFSFLDSAGIVGYADLLLCPTWAHVFYQRSPLYTDEQRTMFREHDMKQFPEVERLYSLDNRDALLDFIASLPQVLTFLPQKGKAG